MWPVPTTQFQWSSVNSSTNLSMALLNKYLCTICHQLLLHNSQTLNDYCMLYTLASSLSTPFQYIGGIKVNKAIQLPSGSRPPLHSLQLHLQLQTNLMEHAVQPPSLSLTRTDPPDKLGSCIKHTTLTIPTDQLCGIRKLVDQAVPAHLHPLHGHLPHHLLQADPPLVLLTAPVQQPSHGWQECHN